MKYIILAFIVISLVNQAQGMDKNLVDLDKIGVSWYEGRNAPVFSGLLSTLDLNKIHYMLYTSMGNITSDPLIVWF